MRKYGLTLALMGLSLGCTWACECVFPSNYNLKNAVDGHPVIFYAKVVSIEDPKDPNFEWIPDLVFDSLYYEKRGYEPQFRIIEVLKGKIGKERKGDRLFFQSNFSTCSVSFELGKTYLVFAYRDESGKIGTSSCSLRFEFDNQEAYKTKRKEIKKALRQKAS